MLLCEPVVCYLDFYNRSIFIFYYAPSSDRGD